MNYLVTGATGDVGSKVVEELVRLGEKPRVFVRNGKRARERFGGSVEIAVGDLGDGAALREAMRGMDRVFLVNSGPEIPARDAVAAEEAKAAGVGRVVKLSSMDVRHGLAIGAWHERGEEAIRASGVAYTFVQPTGFMSNLLAWAEGIRREGVVRSSTGEGRRAFIHSEDIAAVAVKAMTGEEYEGEEIPITGPEAVTFGEATERIGAAMGRRLRFEAISDEEARRRYSVVSGSEEETEAHVALWRAIREGRLGAVTDGVERVLGRPPVGLGRWIGENAGMFGG